MTLWQAVGFIRYPMLFSTLIMGAVAVYSAGRLLRPTSVADRLTKAWIDAVLFWGGFTMVTGVLGTLVGIVLAAQSIESAGSANPVLVWGGIKVALYSSVIGILVLAGSAMLWFGLQLRWRFLDAREAAEL